MRHHSDPPVDPLAPTDDEIREYAHHLYVQSGRIPGRDLENWVEAEACMRTLPPAVLASLRRDAKRRIMEHRRTADSPTQSLRDGAGRRV